MDITKVVTVSDLSFFKKMADHLTLIKKNLLSELPNISTAILDHI